jgi:hypothetical protein
MWEKLTPADIEQAKHDLTLRRTAMLARHAEELRSLDSEQAGLEALERLIDAFMQKFQNQETTAPSEFPSAESEDAAQSVAANTSKDDAAATEAPMLASSANFGGLLRRFGSY